MKITKTDGKCNICGGRIREMRRGRQLSQETLAMRLQLAGMDATQKLISQIETGKRAITDYELECLADVLEVSVSKLLGREAE